jgi:hypothetical protein
VTIPIYIFYWKGPEIRARSKFAQTVAGDRDTRGPVPTASIPLQPLAPNRADEPEIMPA